MKKRQRSEGSIRRTGTQLQPADQIAVKPINDYFAAYLSFVDRSEKTARTYANNLRQFSAWLHYRGIEAPIREDIIEYRDYLLSDHEAISYDPVTGWKYRTGPGGDPLRLRCGANTAAQYLRTVAAFFSWTAATGIYPNIAAGIHAPKIRNDAHRKEAL